jgi:hypothetical protein
MAFDAPTPAGVPAASALRAGASLMLADRGWQVASVTTARLAAAQGELPLAPRLQAEFVVADLRNPQDEVATLDYAEPASPRWSEGRSAALSELALSGLRTEAAEKTLGARGLSCPNCGGALLVQLSTTVSMACPQCSAVVDLSQGAAGDLAHYVQESPQVAAGVPQLPLGTTGTLALGGPPKPWQVVGYVERCEIPDDPEDERVFWREYLLYNRSEGFTFLVDAEDGWSWATPITGAPQVTGDQAVWRNERYRKLYRYTGQITYVLGEFYWKLQRGQRTDNTDYAASTKRLNREQTGSEVTWSAGQTMDASLIAKAFKLPEDTAAALGRDASPLSGSGSGSGSGWPISRTLILAIVLIIVLVVVVKACSKDRCDEMRATFGESSNEYQQCRSSSSSSGVRTSGGSFGGSGSSGGGHK